MAPWIILVIAVVALAGIHAYFTYKTGKGDPTSTEHVKTIVYQAIDDVIRIYQDRADKDLLIRDATALAVVEIASASGITEADKKFWTADKVEPIVRKFFELVPPTPEQK